MDVDQSRIFRGNLLDGSICVVSGAGSGLGRAITLELSRLGATVVGCGRRLEALEETHALLDGSGGGQFEFESLDIRDADAVDGFFDRTLARHQRIDALVNNAGGQFMAPAATISPNGFRSVVELNLQGTWLMTRAAATKAMIPAGGGKVISVTLSPHAGIPGMVHSGAARAGVENMMRTLAVEWADFGVTTVAIAAGQFATEILHGKYSADVVQEVDDHIPLRRSGRPEELAWLVAYLVSRAGDYFSGTTITIDGGRDDRSGQWPMPAFERLLAEGGE